MEGDTKAYTCFFLTLVGVYTSRKRRAIDGIEYRDSPQSAHPNTCFRHSANLRVSTAD